MKRTDNVNRVFRKLNNRAGFTLAETLIAILILLMVSSVVAGGVPAASNAYYKAVDGANAQVLLSTAATALRDELATARDIVQNGEDSLTYYSRDNGRESKILLQGDTIWVKEYVYSTYTGSEDEKIELERQLVSGKASTERLKVRYSKITYEKDKGLVQVEGLEVIRDTTQKTSMLKQNLTIRVIAP